MEHAGYYSTAMHVMYAQVISAVDIRPCRVKALDVRVHVLCQSEDQREQLQRQMLQYLVEQHEHVGMITIASANCIHKHTMRAGG